MDPLELALPSLSLWELGAQEAMIPTALTQVPVVVEGTTPPRDVHDHVLGGHLKAASWSLSPFTWAWS